MVTAAPPKFFIWSSTIMMLFPVILMAAVISAAPSNNEEAMGSSVPRGFYRSRENMPSPDNDNVIIPMTLDGGQLQLPTLYEPHTLGNQQQPTDNAILNFLLARRLVLVNNRLRPYIDTSSNEISRKRSYSKYCAFNAVSCFGK